MTQICVATIPIALSHGEATATQMTRSRAASTTQATTFRNGDSATLALTAAPTERGLWKDGVRGTFTDNTRSADRILYRNTTCDSVIGGDSAREGNSQFPFIGTCNAFRLYNRVLTTEELAVNTAVDAVRFRGATPATLTLPAGWAFDAQGNLLKTVTVSAIGGTVCLGDGAPAAFASTNIVQDASSVTLTFTAAADAGYEFVDWEGDTDAIVSSDGMEVTVDCSGAVSLYAVFRSTSDISPTFTAQGQYATNGLVAWFDGYENAGFGQHSTAATTWKDLSGNGNDASVDTTPVGWGETCYTNIATLRYAFLLFWQLQGHRLEYREAERKVAAVVRQRAEPCKHRRACPERGDCILRALRPNDADGVQGR